MASDQGEPARAIRSCLTSDRWDWLRDHVPRKAWSQACEPTIAFLPRAGRLGVGDALGAAAQQAERVR